MNMLMQIGLKSFQILVEDPVGCAGIRRRGKLVAQASDLCHEIPCMLMLAHHLLQLYLQLAQLSFCRAFTALFFSGNSFMRGNTPCSSSCRCSRSSMMSS